jgi:hypothetical protein
MAVFWGAGELSGGALPVDDPERCNEFLALESRAPALAIPLLLRFFSPPGLLSSVDFRPVGDAKELNLSPVRSPSSSPDLPDDLSARAPGPALGFGGECERVVSLSFDNLVGLGTEPNILFKRLPPCEEKLLLLFPATMIDERKTVLFRDG